MFVSIDMQNMRLLHKHHDHEALSALAFLEACDRSVLIESTDHNIFGLSMTPLELRLLYKNSTGTDITGSDDLAVRQMIITLIDDHMPPTLCLLPEVEAQVNAVEDELYQGVAWKYVLGSKRPTKEIELFPLFTKPLSDVEISKAAQSAATRLQKRGATTPPPLPANAPQSTAPQNSSIKPPKAGTLTGKAWEIFDKVKSEKGFVPTVSACLDLARAEGLNDSTTRTQYGKWRKFHCG